MRAIGHIDTEAKAKAFHDYLFALGIENEVEADKGGWIIWIHDEEMLERAKAELAAFLADPANSKFNSAGKVAEDLREAKRKDQENYEKRLKQRRHLFRPMTAYGFGPITFLLICVSGIIFFRSGFGAKDKLEAISNLFFTNMESQAVLMPMLKAAHFRLAHLPEVLPEISHGEFWRIFTPMFIHFGPLHIFMNMWWLRDLGSMIEARQSSWLLVILVAAFAAISNFCQFLVGGGGFGGMSGVVYALIGYIWIRGKYDPGSGLYLHTTTVISSIVWFFYCLLGLWGPVANMAHGAGFVAGLAWGYLSSLRYR